MENTLINLLEYIQHRISAEILSIILLIFCLNIILLLWHLWKEHGLYLYNIIAICVANIQVLKITTFLGTEQALGTIIFATIFTSTDILTEYRGGIAAKRALNLSFAGQILITLFLLITLVYPTNTSLNGCDGGNIINPIQYSLYNLFTPSLRVLIASLASYYISQICDIYIFSALKNLTNKRFLWLRSNTSTLVAGLLDNFIFSFLAWIVLNPAPVTFYTLMVTYVLGTYVTRIIVSLLSTPILYITRSI